MLFEELAVEFSMTSKDNIDRIFRLQAAGILQGITHDRGKFIQITNQEQEAESRYINSKGRLNKAELLTHPSPAQERGQDHAGKSGD